MSAVKKLWDEQRKFVVSPTLTVTLRHIGKPGDVLWTRMQARWISTMEKLRMAARKELLEQHGTAEAAVTALVPGVDDAKFSAVVEYWARQQETFVDAWNERAQSLIREGLDDGERLLPLVMLEGNVAITRVTDAIHEFNTADPSKGEA